jgi:hypothetical protein
MNCYDCGQHSDLYECVVCNELACLDCCKAILVEDIKGENKKKYICDICDIRRMMLKDI